MNHLGGSGCLVYVEWLHQSHVYGGHVYQTCGRPPRSKEIGDVQVVKFPVQPQVNGLYLDQLSCENSARRTEGGRSW
jgi:hypothetical protein